MENSSQRSYRSPFKNVDRFLLPFAFAVCSYILSEIFDSGAKEQTSLVKGLVKNERNGREADISRQGWTHIGPEEWNNNVENVGALSRGTGIERR